MVEYTLVADREPIPLRPAGCPGRITGQIGQVASIGGRRRETVKKKRRNSTESAKPVTAAESASTRQVWGPTQEFHYPVCRTDTDWLS